MSSVLPSPPGTQPVVGRLAPSPTGAQHVGNARTYLLAWLSARQQQGRVLVRIEDIDSPRIKPGAQQQALDDLHWLGLDWDAGPDRSTNRSTVQPPPPAPNEPVVAASFIQSQRLPLYSEALDRLKQLDLVYPCTCTRSEIENAASAPHAGQEGPVYPGICRQRTVRDALSLGSRPFAWRFRMTAYHTTWSYTDLIAGPQTASAAALGDFVVCKANGTPAYQLAVVVDDHAMGVTEVIRGDDLIPSTFRQLALYQAFGWQPPRFGHVPLVVGPDGRRLAKRHGDTRLSVLREAGIPASQFVGFLAWTAGLQPAPTPLNARALVTGFDWTKLPRTPFVMTDAHWQQLLRSPVSRPVGQ